MKIVLKVALLLFVILWVLLIRFVPNTVFGLSVSHRPALKPGNVILQNQRLMMWNNHSDFADTIIKQWANKSFKDQGGKVNNPRIYLAKLVQKKDLNEVNERLLKTVPWGLSGSVWAMNKKGDYDFTETVLTTILYLFGTEPNILFPKTREHLVNTLLTEEGDNFRYSAPKTLGMVDETENHLLMTEGSRYLKNQWKRNQGNTNPLFDNSKNGMEDKLSALLQMMSAAGLYEFNSLPYTGYTLTALLNIEAFASEKLKTQARNVLDYMNFCYALGSYQYKHFAPMRRRYDKIDFKDLTNDYHSVFMKVWMGFSHTPPKNRETGGADVHALIAAVMPYRPTDQVVSMLLDSGKGYFVQLGHGAKSCGEIYTAGKYFLLSAGGANQGMLSDVVARPTCLFLNDTARVLSQVFHMEGPGTDFMKWNNTGLYKNFACTAGPVFIPVNQVPIAERELWKVFKTKENVLIAIYSANDLGIMLVMKNQDPNTLLTNLIASNIDKNKIKTEFQIPGAELIQYDLQCPQDKWVIKSVDGKPTERNFNQWPLMNGTFEH